MCTGALLAALTPVIFGTPRPMVRVTWKPVDEGARHDLEQRFALSEPTRIDDATWSYVPLDTSTRALRSIVVNPLVADTDGIDRRALTMADDPPLTPRRGGMWGSAPSGAARIALVSAYAVGLIGLGALGFVVLSRLRGADSRTDVAQAVGRASSFAARAAFPLSLVVIFAFVVGYRYVSFEYVTNDHFTYLTFAHQTALGDLPVRDYDDPGFPLMIALSAIAMRLGGMSLLPEVILAGVMFGLAACVTWRAATAYSRLPLVALAAAALQVLAYPRPYSYPKILIPACATVLFLAYARQPARARLLAIALLTELGLLLRHDLAVYVGFATVLLLLFVHRFTRECRQRIALYVGSCVALTIPYALYLLMFGFGAHVGATLGFSRSEASRTGGWTTVLTSGAPLTLALLILPVVVMLWLVVDRSRRDRWSEHAPAVAATAALMLVINLAMVRDTTPARLADVFGPAPVLLAWLAAQAISASRRLRRSSMRAVAFASIGVAGAVLIVATAQFGLLRHYLAEARVESWRSFVSHAERQSTMLSEWPWTGKYQGIAQEPLARYINRCTSRNDTVLIVGYLPHLPVIARRPFAGGHSWLLPGYFTSASDQERMARRLAERPPAVVVIQPEDAMNLENDWPAIARLLRGYREPKVFEGLQIRTPRGLAVRSIHPETGLECFW